MARLSLLAVAAVVAACGPSSQPEPDAPVHLADANDEPGDASGLADGAAGDDGGPGIDAGPQADAGPPPGICESCDSYDDCGPDSLCKDTGGGRVCLPRCSSLAPDCPTGFTCGGVDLTYCAPVDGVCCLDDDDDGWGSGVGCFGPDCDDTSAERNPGMTELCDGIDNDCALATPDGAADPQTGETCDGPDADLCAEGIVTCGPDGVRCSDATGDRADVCNGLDDDCDPATVDGAGDLNVGVACDGADTDLCREGAMACVDGVVTCDDATGDLLDLCNALDDDCNPATADGAHDLTVNVECDGPDSDACAEDKTACVSGWVLCGDDTGDSIERCNGVDDDCVPATADGSGEPTLGNSCDGPDGDRCQEGIVSCRDGQLGCSDTSSTTLDICNDADDDCDPATADGAGDSRVGIACDGPDSDACFEGVNTCSDGVLGCSDPNDADPELCNGQDDDCIPGTPDGSGDPDIGLDCDGADDDLCDEGKTICVAGAAQCSDPNDADPELCNGQDDDCDDTTVDWAHDPAVGPSCDGDDPDLCAEGHRFCTAGGSLACDDLSGPNVELCNGVDDDCIPATQDGSGDAAVNLDCDGADLDACDEGKTYCSGLGTVLCGDPDDANPELCNGLDDDCLDMTADGAGDPSLGLSCDGVDTDLCEEGHITCAIGGTLRCDDLSSNTPDLCNLNLDDDCNPSTPDGYGDADVGDACDGADSDACQEGVLSCTGGTLICTDATFDNYEICNAVDDDCDGLVDEGFDTTLDPLNCGACGNVCSASNGGTLCCASACTPASPTDCGACDVACTAGLLVVTELLINPYGTGTDLTQEWFELYNPGAVDLDLRGFTLADTGTDSHAISLSLEDPVIVPAGDFLVLGNSDNPSTNGGVPVSYQYSNFALGNSGDDEILVSAFGVLIDSVAWASASWDVDGFSNELKWGGTHVENDTIGNWCVAASEDVLPGGSHGTPGEENACQRP